MSRLGNDPILVEIAGTGGCDVSRNADLFDEVRASQPRF
jgi:hypothetical protein